MIKITQSRVILEALGLPPQQHADIACYTLLALANLHKQDRWIDAERRSIRIHDAILFIKNTFKKSYAENTRETMRRQVLHQFEQARIVDRNPDDPGLSTNSPRTHYALSEDALAAIRLFGTPRFAAAALGFKQRHGALIEVYRANRAHQLIPLRLPSGQEIHLSPGRHNALQVAVINEFGPRFAPGAVLIYFGDTAKKLLHFDKEAAYRLGIPVTEHDKLPDVVLHDVAKGWLFLIEAVTSHGPVSAKRKHELDAVLARCPLARIYVSAFPDLREFKRHVTAIAWETEVWVAELPAHLIHFNGDKFLGPAVP